MATTLYETQGQRLEEEAELYLTHAQCAASTAQFVVAVRSQERANCALFRRLAAIADPALQKSFLQMHRHQGVMIPPLPNH